MLRAVHVFPEFDNMQLIHELRAKFDPLAQYIPPHLTLVFPFESEITAGDLERHIERVTRGIGPFPVELAGVTGADGRYLFLNVKEGNDELIRLHDRLYTGLLAPFQNRRLTYIPHLTVGRLDDGAKWSAAVEATESFHHTFTTTVSELAVEQIDEQDMSIVLFSVGLRG